jgi:hypothetical protein
VIEGSTINLREQFSADAVFNSRRLGVRLSEFSPYGGSVCETKSISTRRSVVQSSERSVKDCELLSGKTNYLRGLEFCSIGSINWTINRRRQEYQNWRARSSGKQQQRGGAWSLPCGGLCGGERVTEGRVYGTRSVARGKTLCSPDGAPYRGVNLPKRLTASVPPSRPSVAANAGSRDL